MDIIQKEDNNDPIFQWSITSVAEYIYKAIKKSSSVADAKFHFDLSTLLKRDAVLSGIFSEIVLKNRQLYTILH